MASEGPERAIAVWVLGASLHWLWAWRVVNNTTRPDPLLQRFLLVSGIALLWPLQLAFVILWGAAKELWMTYCCLATTSQSMHAEFAEHEEPESEPVK